MLGAPGMHGQSWQLTSRPVWLLADVAWLLQGGAPVLPYMGRYDEHAVRLQGGLAVRHACAQKHMHYMQLILPIVLRALYCMLLAQYKDEHAVHGTSMMWLVHVSSREGHACMHALPPLSTACTCTCMCYTCGLEPMYGSPVVLHDARTCRTWYEHARCHVSSREGGQRSPGSLP